MIGFEKVETDYDKYGKDIDTDGLIEFCDKISSLEGEYTKGDRKSLKNALIAYFGIKLGFSQEELSDKLGFSKCSHWIYGLSRSCEDKMKFGTFSDKIRIGYVSDVLGVDVFI